MYSQPNVLSSYPGLPELDPSLLVSRAKDLRKLKVAKAVRPIRWIYNGNRVENLATLLRRSEEEQTKLAEFCRAIVLPAKFGYVFAPPTMEIPNNHSKMWNHYHPELPEGAILAAEVPILRNVRRLHFGARKAVETGIAQYKHYIHETDATGILGDLGVNQFNAATLNGCSVSNTFLVDVDLAYKEGWTY